MELAAVFVLSILGGYAFASHWRLIAFRTRRTEGHHLHFRVAFYGAVFFTAALLIRVWLLATFPAYNSLESAVAEYIAPALKSPSNPRQVELVITAGYSLALGPLLAVILNLFTPKHWSLRLSFSALDDLLYRAQQADMPVCITLDTGKVYVGLVVSITDPDRQPASITLFPMFSGSRDDQGRLQLTTDYERVYKTLNSEPKKLGQLGLLDAWEENFEVVLRAASIVTATMFSPSLYAEFNPGWRKSIGSRFPPPPKELLVEIKPRPSGKA